MADNRGKVDIGELWNNCCVEVRHMIGRTKIIDGE